MGLKRDLSDLPTRAPQHGRRPGPYHIMPLVMEQWRAVDELTRSRPMADDAAVVRHSWAGHCARRLGYEIGGVPASDEIDEASYWAMSLGSLVHGHWAYLVEPALTKAGWTDVVPEAVRVVDEGIRSAAHLDLSGITPGGKRACVEVKTINGFGYKTVVGAAGNRPGPRASDFVQGCVNAAADHADVLIMLYVAMENMAERYAISAGLDPVLGRFCAEFTFDRDEFTPVAEEERGRWVEVERLVRGGFWPEPSIPFDPEFPQDAVIVDAATGRWEQRTPDGYVTGAGRTWHCGYCPYQSLCQTNL